MTMDCVHKMGFSCVSLRYFFFLAFLLVIDKTLRAVETQESDLLKMDATIEDRLKGKKKKLKKKIIKKNELCITLCFNFFLIN